MEDWIKKNYEQAILVVVSVLVALVCGWLIFKAVTFSKKFAIESSAKGTQFEDTGEDKLVAATKRYAETSRWTHPPTTGPLLSSVQVLLKDGDLFETAEGKLYDPITNEWCRKYDLALEDPELPNNDPDGDGFSNLEEFLGGTDPTDADSKPPVISKLCLVNMVEPDLFLRFETKGTDIQIGIIEGDPTQRQRNIWEKRGGSFDVPGGQMRIESYEKVTEINPTLEIEEDKSIVTVSDRRPGRNNYRIPLTRGETTPVPTFRGVFENKAGGAILVNDEAVTELTVGDVFILEDDPKGEKWQVVQITSDGAKIKKHPVVRSSKAVDVPLCE